MIVPFEGALNSLLTTELTPVRVHTGSAPQSAPYPFVIIEQVTPLPFNKTFETQRKAGVYEYQFRCVSYSRAEALQLMERVRVFIMTKKLPWVVGGVSCIGISMEPDIPPITLPDRAMVMHTQAGCSFTFMLQ